MQGNIFFESPNVSYAIAAISTKWFLAWGNNQSCFGLLICMFILNPSNVRKKEGNVRGERQAPLAHDTRHVAKKFSALGRW
jgi:hypothetical protein